MSDFEFQPAERHSVKARIALAGPSGSGKTYTSLCIAAGFGGRVAVVDTEKGSASLYADEFTFDVLELGPPFDPERYVSAIHAAENGGYDVIVVDSLSHAWFDEGGVLDIVDKASKGSNKFAGWQKGTPAQNALIGAVVRSRAHIIATMRSKVDYALSADGKKITKLGMAPIQREGVDYEFSLVGEMDVEHMLTVTKSRFRSLQDQTVRKPGREFGERILAEITKGSSEPPRMTSDPSPSEITEDTAAGSGKAPTTNGEDEPAPESAATTARKPECPHPDNELVPAPNPEAAKRGIWLCQKCNTAGFYKQQETLV